MTDNFAVLDGRHWQVHVYGAPGPGLEEACRTAGSAAARLCLAAGHAPRRTDPERRRTWCGRMGTSRWSRPAQGAATIARYVEDISGAEAGVGHGVRAREIGRFGVESAAMAGEIAVSSDDTLSHALSSIAQAIAASLELRPSSPGSGDACQPLIPFDGLGLSLLERGGRVRVHAVAGDASSLERLDLNVARADYSPRLWPRTPALPGQRRATPSASWTRRSSWTATSSPAAIAPCCACPC